MIGDKSAKPIFTACISITLLLGIMMPFVNTGTINEHSSSSKSTLELINDGNNILYVGGSGPNNYTYIQDAIDDAPDESMIFIYDNSSPYREDFVVYKPLKFLGEKRDTTVLDGIMIVDADNVSAQDLNITGHMKFISGRECHVRYCSFNDGGLFFHASQSSIYDCSFLRGSIGLQGTDNHIFKNTFRECGDGISYDWSGPNLIENNSFTSNNIGIYIHGGKQSYGSTIKNNIFTHNGRGIALSEAGGHTIYNNTFTGDGISIGGKVYTSYGPNYIYNNTVNGKPILYFYEKNDLLINENITIGQIILVGCNNITVTHHNIEHTYIGIRIWDCTNCHICENNISHCHWGVWLQDSSSNIITYNNFVDNEMHGAITAWKGNQFNYWNRNYWDHWRFPLPRIFGGIKNADWLPRIFPYNWWSQ